MKRYIILIVLIVMLILGFIAFGKAYGKKDSTIKQIFKQEKFKEYHSGDIVSFNKEEWYVLHNSSNKDNYVTLIYKGILFLDDESLSSVDYDVYESSVINKYLKNEYVNKLGEDKLREVHGYKARLFNEDDLSLLKTTYDKYTDSYELIDCPDFICLTNVDYGTMIPTKNGVEGLDELEHLSYYNVSTTYDTYKLESLVEDNTLFIRPVINVYKESLDE